MCDKQSKHCTSSPTGSSAASRSLILSGSLLRVLSGCLDGSSGCCLIIGHWMTLSGLTSFWSAIVTPTHQNRKVQTVSDFGAATPPALTQWGKHLLTLPANMNDIWIFIYYYFSSLAVMEQTSFVAGTKRWSSVAASFIYFNMLNHQAALIPGHWKSSFDIPTRSVCPFSTPLMQFRVTRVWHISKDVTGWQAFDTLKGC